jgi:hypothetical protein
MDNAAGRIQSPLFPPAFTPPAGTPTPPHPHVEKPRVTAPPSPTCPAADTAAREKLAATCAGAASRKPPPTPRRIADPDAIVKRGRNSIRQRGILTTKASLRKCSFFLSSCDQPPPLWCVCVLKIPPPAQVGTPGARLRRCVGHHLDAPPLQRWTHRQRKEGRGEDCHGGDEDGQGDGEVSRSGWCLLECSIFWGGR